MNLLLQNIKRLVVDNLDSNDSSRPLSARCGKTLLGIIEKKNRPLEYIGRTTNTSYQLKSYPNGHTFDDYEYFVLCTMSTQYYRILASTVIPVVQLKGFVTPDTSDIGTVGNNNECYAVYPSDPNVYATLALFRKDGVYLRIRNSTYGAGMVLGKLK